MLRSDGIVWRCILALVFVLWTLPFLVPDHGLPLTTFYPELLAMAVTTLLFVVAFVLQSRRPGTLPVPGAMLVLIGLVCVLFIQLATMRNARPVAAFLAIFFCVCAMLAMQAGCWIGQNRRHTARVLRACAIGSLIGGLISAGMAWMQAFGLEANYGHWVAQFPYPQDRRLFANLYQANHLGTVLCLAIASALYLRHIRAIGSTVLVVSLVMLSIGAGLTASRTPWLQVVVISSGSVALTGFRPSLADKNFWQRCFLLGIVPLVIFAGAQVLVSWLNVVCELHLSLSAAGRMTGSATGSPRLALWGYAVEIFREHPFLGAGWGEFVRAQYLAADHLGPVPPANSSHNLVLDLLAKTGIFGTLAALVPCALWVLRVLKAARRSDVDGDRVFCLTMVSVFGVHAMLEFPQNYAFFLLPVCLLMGLAETRTWQGMTRALSVSLSTAMALGVSAGLVAGYFDYKKIEVAYERDELQRYAFDPALIFGDWGRYSLTGMMSLDREMLAEKIDMHEVAMTLSAAPNYIRRYIVLLALDNRQDEALLQVKRLKNLSLDEFDRHYAGLVAMCDEQNGALDKFKARLLHLYGNPKPQVAPASTLGNLEASSKVGVGTNAAAVAAR